MCECTSVFFDLSQFHSLLQISFHINQLLVCFSPINSAFNLRFRLEEVCTFSYWNHFKDEVRKVKKKRKMMIRRRLACCTKDMREISIDFDERIMTYNGLETCILNSGSYDNESRTSVCMSDSFDEDDSASSSTTTNHFGSFSSLEKDEWAPIAKCLNLNQKQKHHISARFLDIDTMKEKFAKLLLGDDVMGGARGVSTALALSNAITNLAASVFGELWKLEPFPEERKRKWRREMEWLLSPTNYMVELVPSKQGGVNGRTLEETLDSMMGTEFWYAMVGSRAEGRSRNDSWKKMRWWLPSPRVPAVGLSDIEIKRLLHKGKLVYQVFKAAKSINENILAEMPIPAAVKDSLPKSGKVSLGEELNKILNAESLSPEEMVNCMNLKSEHGASEAINRLEAAILAWKEKIVGQVNKKSTVQPSWPFTKDSLSELDRFELLVNRAELLVHQLKIKYPNLPQTFFDATKIQYGKDVGHSILEAYSRVMSNLAFSILSRIGDILQEDVMSNPNSPTAMPCLVGAKIPGISDSPMLDRVRHSLVH
ncbi:Rop guanine nucleotide exchange factor [Striga asiatica]|uniref:Rop guanine nucleotide exchange factor n=1 Tax=Striga asiatica TaxID=4170 RepID=A0A5A7RAG7_STRAF|nr:Rop guanine nucleotide exchange factor [Striga asiatica]